MKSQPSIDLTSDLKTVKIYRRNQIESKITRYQITETK